MLVATAVLLGACTGPSPVPAGAGTGAAGGPSAVADTTTPAPTAVPTLAPGAIQHRQGPRDILLRVAQTGGFIGMEVVMGRTPAFTLYGDGTILLTPAADTAGQGAGGGVNPGGLNPGGLNPGGGASVPISGVPLRQGRLDEEDVQQLLAYAQTEGMLGSAKPEYRGMIMDLPTTLFQIHTGDVDRTVSVGGLGADPTGPDAVAYRALASLADKLRSLPTQRDYQPGAWVGVLAEAESQPGAPAVAWPWKDLAPADFSQPAADDPVPFARHLLTQDQVGALGAAIGEGGASGFRLAGPDGKVYLLAVRPALPEELPAG